MSKNLVIVESPAKAKTIGKYLGKDFDVMASYGHVRDLVPKEGAVDPEHGFAMKYQVIERNEKHVKSIVRALKKADALYLATDPDREGEAISWHLIELLKEKDALNAKDVHRVVFHEITKKAVQEAIDHPRDISGDLVGAQQARRALDFLVGFNLSPLLWKKVQPGLSAGRVQSPALRMIVERELEIELFLLFIGRGRLRAVVVARGARGDAPSARASSRDHRGCFRRDLRLAADRDGLVRGADGGGATGARGRDAGVHLSRGDHVCSIVSRSCAVVREVMAPGTPALLPSRTTRDSPNLGADWSSGHASRILPPDIYFSSLNKTCTRRLFCLPLRSAFRVLFHIVYEVSPGTGLEEVFFQFSKVDSRYSCQQRPAIAA